MTETNVAIPCGVLSLEGIVSMPEETGTFPSVVVCHPHPLYGGNMDNNVVSAVCRALSQASIAHLRFNFRGVGRSQGKYEDGVGEQDDVDAALSFLSTIKGTDKDRIGLCGYSFGAGVALDAAARNRLVSALALVSPVLSHPSPIETYTKPKLIFWGSNDLVLPTSDLKRFTDDLPEPGEYEIIAGADHFWWDDGDKIAAKIAAFFARTLKGPSQEGQAGSI